MTHVQIDDAMFDHPKLLRVSSSAKLLEIAAICYAGNMLTDGFIPFGAVAVLGAKTGVLKTKLAVDELIAAGLWEHCDGGYYVHDYLDYNTPAEKVRANRDAAKERARRNRSREVRPNFSGTSDEVREPTTTTTTRSYEPIGSPERGSGEHSPNPPPPKRKPRLTDCPPDFSVTAEMRDWAKSKHGIDDDEINRRDEYFWNYVGRVGKQYARWDLAWKDAMGWTKDRSPATNGHSSRSITASHAGEDREYLLRGLPPVWGSANGGIDSL